MRFRRKASVATCYLYLLSDVTGFSPKKLVQRPKLSLNVEGVVGPRVSIQDDYPGLKQLHSNPDVFLIENFLDTTHCEKLIQLANDSKALATSPVAYAGWTRDFSDLLQLAAKGPVVWASLLTAWFQLRNDSEANQVSLVLNSLQNYAMFLVFATIVIATVTFLRAQSLQMLRTSTSTTLNDLSEVSVRTFISNTAKLLGSPREAACFEAPTIIRYEPGQALAPHFDANRSADTEDSNRGGQTLVTLLLYLNNVREGGLTRFGGIDLSVQPTVGQALVFFPADARGNFDDRTEHEGCPAIDEKWIARIWRHQECVPPPFGLSDEALQML